jgi:hypothetical protein
MQFPFLLGILQYQKLQIEIGCTIVHSIFTHMFYKKNTFSMASIQNQEMSHEKLFWSFGSFRSYRAAPGEHASA